MAISNSDSRVRGRERGEGGEGERERRREGTHHVPDGPHILQQVSVCHEFRDEIERF